MEDALLVGFFNKFNCERKRESAEICNIYSGSIRMRIKLDGPQQKCNFYSTVYNSWNRSEKLRQSVLYNYNRDHGTSLRFHSIVVYVWRYNIYPLQHSLVIIATRLQEHNVQFLCLYIYTKLYLIFRLNLGTVHFSMRKMLVFPDSRDMYKSFGT